MAQNLDKISRKLYNLIMNITKKQKQMLDFIDGFIKGNGYSPTYREIMRALGYKSVSTVAKHIDNLVILGKLEKRDGEVRSISLYSHENNPPWWVNLEQEIQRRKKSTDKNVIQEAEVLQKALEIVKR